MHNEEAIDLAAEALQEEGVRGSILDLLEQFLKMLLDGCELSNEALAAEFDKPSLRFRRQLTSRAWSFLFQTYGAGAWYRHDGPALVEKTLAAGKKAKAEHFAALRN